MRSLVDHGNLAFNYVIEALGPVLLHEQKVVHNVGLRSEASRDVREELNTECLEHLNAGDYATAQVHLKLFFEALIQKHVDLTLVHLDILLLVEHIVEVATYFVADLRREILLLCKVPVDVEHFLTETSGYSIEARHDVADAVDDVGEDTATEHHEQQADGTLDSSLRRQVSVAYTAHGGERPVHTCDVSVLKRHLVDIKFYNPAVHVSSHLIHADVEEQARHVVCHDDNLDRDIKEGHHEVHRVSDDVLFELGNKFLYLHHAQYLQHFEQLGDLQELQQLRRLSKSTTTTASRRISISRIHRNRGVCDGLCDVWRDKCDVVGLDGANAEALRVRQNPRVWNGADKIDPEPQRHIILYDGAPLHNLHSLHVDTRVEVEKNVDHEHDIDGHLEMESEICRRQLEGDPHGKREALVNERREQRQVP